VKWTALRDGVLGAERVKFRGVPLEWGPPGDDGEFKAGILPLESDDLSDGLTMLPLDLRIIGLEGDRVGVYDLSFDDCCCAVRNAADLALLSGKGIAFIVVPVFIDAEG
jgi:hypothetical protein